MPIFSLTTVLYKHFPVTETGYATQTNSLSPTLTTVIALTQSLPLQPSRRTAQQARLTAVFVQVRKGRRHLGSGGIALRLPQDPTPSKPTSPSGGTGRSLQAVESSAPPLQATLAGTAACGHRGSPGLPHPAPRPPSGTCSPPAASTPGLKRLRGSKRPERLRG